MSIRFVNVDRDTRLLLPPDLCEWVPADDLVHFVLESVDGMRLGSLRINARGSGSAQYPPKMMLALLIYCYCNGIFSSRRIERATYRDIAVRYLTADTHPDHDTICKFRRENFEAISEAFLDVLKLAKKLKLLKVGTVSVDGTHIKANGSRDKNVTYERACELEEQLGKDIQELLVKAEQADESAIPDGQSLPKEIARRDRLREKIRGARESMERAARDKASSERAEYERKVQARDERQGKRKGPNAKPPKDVPEGKNRINLTDCDSRLMRKNERSGYEQVYNAQAAVDADGSQLVVSAHVSQCASDANELIPAIAGISEEVGKPTRVLADTGYVNSDAFDKLEQEGFDLYVAVSREENHDRRRYDYRPAKKKRSKVITSERLLAMKQKVGSEAGRSIYAKRKSTVEPVFGIIKQVMGFREFLLRGKEKVSGEWQLVCLAYDVKRLWRLEQQAEAI